MHIRRNDGLGRRPIIERIRIRHGSLHCKLRMQTLCKRGGRTISTFIAGPEEEKMQSRSSRLSSGAASLSEDRVKKSYPRARQGCQDFGMETNKNASIIFLAPDLFPSLLDVYGIRFPPKKNVLVGILNAGFQGPMKTLAS